MFQDHHHHHFIMTYEYFVGLSSLSILIQLFKTASFASHNLNEMILHANAWRYFLTLLQILILCESAVPPGGASTSSGPAVNPETGAKEPFQMGSDIDGNIDGNIDSNIDNNIDSSNSNNNSNSNSNNSINIPQSERNFQEVITQSQPKEIHPSPPPTNGRIAFTHKHNTKDPTAKQRERQRPLQLMDHESIALTLRLTCEINQRLVRRISSLTRCENIHSLETVPPTHELHTSSGGGGGGAGGSNYRFSSSDSTLVHVHPSQAWERPIASHRSQAMTTPSPQQQQRHYFKATAQDLFVSSSTVLKQPCHLSQYISTLTESLGLESSSRLTLIQAIALLYLDRACSVETTRVIEMKCPFCTLENVSLLYQTAFIMACRTVQDELPFSSIRGGVGGVGSGFHDEVTAKYAHWLSLGGMDVTARHLGDRLEFMSRCLGSEGFAIHSKQVDTLLKNWRHLFHLESEEDRLGNQSEQNQERQRPIESYNGDGGYNMPPDGSIKEGSLDQQQGESWAATEDNSYARDVHDPSQYTSDPMMQDSQHYNEWGGMDQSQLSQNDMYQNFI